MLCTVVVESTQGSDVLLGRNIGTLIGKSIELADAMKMKELM